MSSYLTIRKKDTIIGEWSRSTDMYSLFSYATYGEWNKFDAKKAFSEAITEVEEKIHNLKKKKQDLVLVLQGLNSAEERLDMVGRMRDYKEMLKEAYNLLAQLAFLSQMSYLDDEEWFWMID